MKRPKNLTSQKQYSVEDVVSLLPGLKKNAIYRYCRTGALPFTVVGRRYYVAEDDLNEFLNSRHNPSR